MASSSEDVLHVVQSVWHKKSAGSLYLMGQRVAWMADSKSVFQITHKYIDIKIQKISPDTKPKVQLQLVMHNGEANTFHFNNPGGREACVRDREKVKEMLQRLLPQFRNKVNSELEMKHKMLQENEQLFQLYNDLVVSGVITAEEFWVNRTQLHKDNLSQSKVGISQSFFSQIKPESSGANSMSYNLTTETIDAIFRTYPQVRAKHLECVPHHMTESEFWTKFFQSHYFHKDRTNLVSDLFNDCAKQDDKDTQSDLTVTIKKEKDLNLDGMTDHPVGENFEDITTESRVSTSTTNQTIIKRFNHHSSRILKTTEQSDTDTIQIHEKNKRPADDAEELEDFEDLRADAVPDKKSKLTLTKTDRYFHGPVPQATQSKYRTAEDMLAASQAVAHEVAQWTDETKCTLTADNARDILTQLSPGGSLMKSDASQSSADLVPSDVHTELRNLYSAVNELLRHFWACFPAHTKQLEEKLVRMEQNLNRFQTTKLMPFKEKIQPYSFSFNLTDHIESQLEAALSKFSKWQKRQMNKTISTPSSSLVK